MHSWNVGKKQSGRFLFIVISVFEKIDFLLAVQFEQSFFRLSYNKISFHLFQFQCDYKYKKTSA